jgi:arylsulfatase A-like enzyme
VSNLPVMTIDIFPTVASLIAAKLPDHEIDGRDVWPIISGDPYAVNPHRNYFFYYNQNDLEAMLSADGRWKLVMPHKYRTLAGRAGGFDGKPVEYDSASTMFELYDLNNDIAEAKDVANDYPTILSDMVTIANEMRKKLGDNLTRTTGSGVRPPGRVE